MLVRGGNRAIADAIEWRRLPVPGLPAQDGGTSCQSGGHLMERCNISAVLLDMDGTLLDTEKVHLESLIAALTTCGYTDDITALCHTMIGIPGPECEIMLRDRFGPDFPFTEIDRAFDIKREEIIKAGMPLKPGAVELLDALQHAGYPMAVVTSSSQRTADKYLTLAGIHGRFEAILTRDDVARGKPDPELYLLAASRLGFKPPHCLAIEDSNPGVASAHAAGAITVMVPDIVPPTAASRAKCAAVLPDLAAVAEMLRDWGALTRTQLLSIESQPR
jgi:HAD superfamily hydrolase (TIGR01509 family)